MRRMRQVMLAGLVALMFTSHLVAQTRAERDLLDALSKPETAFSAALDLAKFYRQAGRTDEAVAMLERAMGLLRQERSTPAPRPPAPPPGPFRVGGDVTAPRQIRGTQPVLPEGARAAGVSGSVLVEIEIDATGRVSSARVLRSIPRLDAAALEAVRRWEYEPATLLGRPVPVIVTAVVTFRPDTR